MKPGDLVKLKLDPNDYYDWGCIPPRTERGFYLRDPETKNLLNGVDFGKKVEFNNTDVCLVLNVNKNLVMVIAPRREKGLIHVDKIEVLE